MIVRKILTIDEEKCTGCGLCIPSCAEEALQIVDGKVRLIKDIYCDGLGACIGECPFGAISIEEREAEPFDEGAVKEHLKTESLTPTLPTSHPTQMGQQLCPSSRTMHFDRNIQHKEILNNKDRQESMLSQWPVQLKLLPTKPPFFENADLLITADCVPFAYANFHNDFLKDRALVIGCPKLDDSKFYMKKLTEIFKHSRIKSIKVLNMEVPCCFGLYHLVKQALGLSGKDIPLSQEIISIKGHRISPS